MNRKKAAVLCILTLSVCWILYGKFVKHISEVSLDPIYIKRPTTGHSDLAFSKLPPMTDHNGVTTVSNGTTTTGVDFTDKETTTVVTNNTETTTTASNDISSTNTAVVDEISTDSNPKSQPDNPQFSLDVIHNLSNVVINRGPGRTVHHIYSAYYDSRKMSNRPAIVMFGYVYKRTRDKIRCKFIYEDNSTKCMENLVHTPLIASNVRPESYFCKMSSGDRVPTHVVLSESGTCKGSNWSSPIPVWNRERPVKEGIGVCVHGVLFNSAELTSEDIFDLVVEFVAMVKVLGVQIVTIYNLNTKHGLLEKIIELYPGFVDMVQWKNLTGILHYHGQRVLINDCLYRNMKRVKYLAFIDLDEMIFPVSTNNWSDMLQILEKKGKYASFTFSNNLFAEVPANASVSVTSHSCPYPKYFARIRRLPWPDFKQKTKMKMIVKPEAVSALCIHDICKPTVSGYSSTFRVPPSVGLMDHYRVPIPRWYIYGKGVEDRTALKYKDHMMQEMSRVCSLIDT